MIGGRRVASVRTNAAISLGLVMTNVRVCVVTFMLPVAVVTVSTMRTTPFGMRSPAGRSGQYTTWESKRRSVFLPNACAVTISCREFRACVMGHPKTCDASSSAGEGPDAWLDPASVEPAGVCCRNHARATLGEPGTMEYLANSIKYGVPG